MRDASVVFLKEKEKLGGDKTLLYRILGSEFLTGLAKNQR